MNFNEQLRYLRPRRIENISQQDIIIFVLGPSGAGKSSFINTVTNYNVLSIGDEYTSCTGEVQCVESFYLGDTKRKTVVFVDIPSFDHNEKTEEEIQTIIEKWLKKNHTWKRKECGILYLRRISDPKTDDGPVEDLKRFERLCGERSPQNALIATTMWSLVDQKTGLERENALREISPGLLTFCFENTAESAWRAVDMLFKGREGNTDSGGNSEHPTGKHSKALSRSGTALVNTMQSVYQTDPSSGAPPGPRSDSPSPMKPSDHVSPVPSTEQNKELSSGKSLQAPPAGSQAEKAQKLSPVETAEDNHDSSSSWPSAGNGKRGGAVFRFFARRPTKMPTGRSEPQRKASRTNIASSVAPVKTEDLSEDDLIIAVMGPTGAGKSSFIGMATGYEHGVGHDLRSCTTEIGIVRLQCPERSVYDVVFVDTPGFDHTNKTDEEILGMIADWLKKTYRGGIKLSGILYFHRISDNRMAGTPLKNLRMFQELCGQNALQNIIFTTTMWDEVDEETGSQREKELSGKYWKAMIDQGSKTLRYNNTWESAWDVLDPFLQSGNDKYAVLLQEEMVQLGMQVRETSAGQALFSTMENLVKKQQDMLHRIRTETERQGDEQAVNALKEEYEALRKELEKTMTEMQTLKLSLGKRLLRTFKSPLLGKRRCAVDDAFEDRPANNFDFSGRRILSPEQGSGGLVRGSPRQSSVSTTSSIAAPSLSLVISNDDSQVSHPVASPAAPSAVSSARVVQEVPVSSPERGSSSSSDKQLRQPDLRGYEDFSGKVERHEVEESELIVDTVRQSDKTVRRGQTQEPEHRIQGSREPSASNCDKDLLEWYLDHAERNSFSGCERPCLVTDLTGQVEVYDEDEEQASGGFANIYRGQKGGKEVAIKVLYIRKGKNDGRTRLIKGLAREIRAWHRLDHPNIVKLLGVWYPAKGPPGIVMPWYQNGNAADYLESKQFSIATRIMLLKDIARALNYMHNLDPPVVHGDLKGNNILIDDDEHATLTDFGLSQLMEEGSTGLTTVTVAGSVRWQAPETLNNDSKQRLTTASDVWSFSCTAYELLTDKLPYYKSTKYMVGVEIIKGATPSWEENGVALYQISSELRCLFDRCWSYKASDRPSMRDIVATLERH